MRVLLRDLAPGQQYALQFRGTNGEAFSAWSPIYRFTTTNDTVAPGSVTSLTWTQNRSSFVAHWVTPTVDANGNDLNDLRNYHVTVSDGTTVASYETSGTSFEFSQEQNISVFGSLKDQLILTVRAVDMTYNESTPVTLTASPSVPPTPSTPIVTNYLGLLSVAFDGKSSGGTNMPDNFSHVEVHVSPTTGFTPSTTTYKDRITTGNSSINLTGLTYGTTYFVKFIAVNHLDKKSAASAQASGSPQRISGLDISNGQIGTAQINFTAFDIGGANAYYPASNAARDALTGVKNGDIAYVTGTGYTTFRYNGTTWVAAPEIGVVQGSKIIAGTVTAGAVGTNLLITAAANIANAVIDDAKISSLNAAKILTGEIAVGQKIISGPVAGPHAEVTADGFRTFNIDPLTGVLFEATRMGTTDNDAVAISDATGTIKAGMDTSGKIVGTDLSITNWPVVGGYVLKDYIDDKSRGLITWGEFAGGAAGRVAEGGDCITSYVGDPGRMYQVVLGPIQVASTVSGDFVQIAIRFTIDGSDPTPSSNYVSYAIAQHNNTVQISSLFQVPGTPGDAVPIKFLMTHARNFGSGTTTATSARGYISVVDIGPVVPVNLITGGGTGAAPVQNYDSYFNAAWWKTWNGSNALISMGNNVYQGYQSANGNTKSMIGFNDITSTLTGSTINSMWVYVYAGHWWYNDGGYPIIGAHGNLSPVTTWPSGAGAQFTGPKMARGEGRWIQLPTSWHASFATGTWRGLVVGPGPSTDPIYYGYYDAPSMQLRVNYRK